MKPRQMKCYCPPLVHFRTCLVQYSWGWIDGNHNVRDIIDDELDYVNEMNKPNNIEYVLDKVTEYTKSVYAAHGLEYPEYDPNYVYE
jgi:hypothetical protein